jgi:hypothetical protein
MRCECHKQAFGIRETSTLDALGDPLWIHSLVPEGKSIAWTRLIPVVSGRLFAVRSLDCLRDGSDEVVRFFEIGSCSLQEEQML